MGSFDRGILTYQSIVARLGSTGGYVNLSAGTNTLSGFAEFYSSKGVRQGYIGKSSTTATADAGTIPYVAGTHAFSGAVTLSSSLNVATQILCPSIAGYTNGVTGYTALSTGNATNSGYITFYSAGQVRQGYIGFSNTTATVDAGTIPYIAGTHAFTGAATFSGTISANNGFLVMSQAAGSYKYITLATGGLARWIFGADNSAESGSSAGSNLFLNRYDDAGAYLGQIFNITRSSGAVTFSVPITATQFNGPVTALKSATTTVSVSAATAPTIGQVLTATSSTTATWQSSSAGRNAAQRLSLVANCPGAF